MKKQWPLAFEILENRRLLTAIILTNQEQLLLELANRARSNPAAEAARFKIDLNDGLPAGTLNDSPKQPLAPNQLLNDAAVLHTQDMFANNFFDHTNLQGKDAGDRIADIGYVATAWAENIAANLFFEELDLSFDALASHARMFANSSYRVNQLNDLFNEAGMGVRSQESTDDGTYYRLIKATEKLAVRAEKVFITGVAYSDTIIGNSFYSIGEGLGGLTVVAEKTSGERFETETGPSGGYALEVSSGTYTVTFSGGPLTSPKSFPSVVIDGKNVKVDLNTSQAVLSLTLDKSSVAENSGSMTATVSRTGDTTVALQVDITSNQRSEANFPTSVTIPAGSASVTFTIAAVNDTLPDGDQNVTIEASAIGYAIGTGTFKVIDDDQLIALPDQQLTTRNQSVDVAVVANDIFPNSQLADLIVEITTPPTAAHGTASVVNQRISVVPATNFEGIVTLAYRIRDPRIGTSEPALLRVGVAASAKHNSLAPLDVDANGNIAPSDASIVINLLNDSNASRLVSDMFSPLGVPFVDVNGSGTITPADALLIINALNTRASGDAEGESNGTVSLTTADMVDMASFDYETYCQSTLPRCTSLTRSKRK